MGHHPIWEPLSEEDAQRMCEEQNQSSYVTDAHPVVFDGERHVHLDFTDGNMAVMNNEICIYIGVQD
jgi:hypothetical protein